MSGSSVVVAPPLTTLYSGWNTTSPSMPITSAIR